MEPQNPGASERKLGFLGEELQPSKKLAVLIQPLKGCQ
jgi:hypothetical protein